MISKLCYFFLIIFISYTSNSPLLYASISDEIEEKTGNKKNGLSVDYLRNIPYSDYIIGPGDTLNVIVSRGYPELNKVATIDGQGTIYLPKLKRVYVDGLTISELNQILNKAYSKFIKYPSAEVGILSYRPIRILVEGEVGSPGLITMSGSLSLIQNTNIAINPSVIPSQENIQTNTFRGAAQFSNYFPTVFDAIRQSGGITKYSDLSQIQIIRKANKTDGSGLITTTLNFEDVILRGDNNQNIRIYDSDIIKVKKSDKPNKTIFSRAIVSNLNSKFLNVFVFGRVQNPGDIKVSRLGTLNDAVEIAGAKIIKGPLTFLRFNNDGSIEKRIFRYRKKAKRGSYKNPLLKDGDLIVVGENAITISSEIIGEVTKPLVGILSTYGLIKAFND